jgi:spore germination protein GerM
MNRRTVMIGAGAAAIVLVGGMLVFSGRQRPGGGTTPVGSPPAGPAGAAAAERKITATLFFITEDGMALQPVQREVPFGDPVAEQARRIIEAQIAAAPSPLASAIPGGTKLRALFVSERGDAFVDLTAEVTSRHTGGALDELFTVYAIVNALTVNLPAITRVQILIDGKEADTLAGHVDLRHPLTKSLKWIKTDNPS